MRLIMLGTGPFAVPTLRALVAGPHEVLFLVTRPPRGRAKERDNPMLQAAEELSLDSWAPSSVNDPEAQARLSDYRADLDAAAKLINQNTALVVGSAPNYPFGVIDPIPELAALAAERGISFHTDACLGGFLLPFYERLGVEVPPFDFRVPGVTTI